MAKIKYFYNTETCEFEKAKKDWRTLLKSTYSYLAFGIVFTLIMFSIRIFFFDSPKEKMLISKNIELKLGITDIENKISVLEKDINSLHSKDNELYRTIFSLDPISKGEWQAGTGGKAELHSIGEESLRETNEKVKGMVAKVHIQEQSFQKLFKEFVDKEEQLKHMPSIRPVNGVFVSGFGMRFHPILKIKKKHTGIDFACKEGTPIYATADGVIDFAGVNKNGYGKHIVMNHGFGYKSKYAHLSKLKVRKGQRIKRGDIIGLSGNTGLSKGPHLHYEIIQGGNKINPIDFFYSDLSPDEYVDFKKMAEVPSEPMD